MKDCDKVAKFRLLFGGSTFVQLPLTKYKIYLTFSSVFKRIEFCD